MKRLALVLASICFLLTGCGAKPAESGPRAPAAPPVSTPADPQTAMRLVPYQSDLFGVSFSYPENLGEPEVTQTGLPHLRLDLGNGALAVYRDEAQIGNSLADLATENIEANTQASHGRIVSRNLGRQLLGGREAWAVQRHFDSAAGRTDSVTYFLLAGGFEYRIGCETKQGPPVVPWDAVAPVCARILETLRFGP